MQTLARTPCRVVPRHSVRRTESTWSGECSAGAEPGDRKTKTSPREGLLVVVRRKLGVVHVQMWVWVWVCERVCVRAEVSFAAEAREEGRTEGRTDGGREGRKEGRKEGRNGCGTAAGEAWSPPLRHRWTLGWFVGCWPAPDRTGRRVYCCPGIRGGLGAVVGTRATSKQASERAMNEAEAGVDKGRGENLHVSYRGQMRRSMWDVKQERKLNEKALSAVFAS
jgi:hypothetical protein